MGIYVRDALINEVANSIAAEHEDYGMLDESVEKFAHGIALYAARMVLPEDDKIAACASAVITLVKDGGGVPVEPEDLQRMVEETISETLFPYFKPNYGEAGGGFELDGADV